MTRIRFVCQHCGQKLSAGPRRAGQSVDCPKCHLSTLIPHQTASAAPAEAASADADSDDAALFPEFNVYDEQTEWVYERDSEGERARGELDTDKVAVPRRILYLQGALLGATAIACFLLGAVFGRSFAPRATVAAAPTPCRLTGKVEYSRGGFAAAPDAGSIVIVVPHDSKPDRRARLQLENLASVTNENDPTVAALREFGGDLAVADESGQFALRVPDTGRYYLLVLSANSQRPAQEELSRIHLSEMGTYFGPALRLLGDRKYQWRTENITRDRQLDVMF